MIYKAKDINIKSRVYNFFNDFINMENIDPNNIKINDKSYKNTFIYYNGNVTIKNT